MKLDDLVAAEYNPPEPVDDAGSLAESDAVEGEAVSDDDTYQDLCQALWFLESCMRMLGFFSDHALAPKLMKVDRERMGKLAKEIQEFVSQWDNG